MRYTITWQRTPHAALNTLNTNTDNETAKQRAIFLWILFGKLALRCIVFAAAA